MMQAVMLLPFQLFPSLLAFPSEVEGPSLLVHLPPFAAAQQLRPFSDAALPAPRYTVCETTVVFLVTIDYSS